jgi:hypothetical protein
VVRPWRGYIPTRFWPPLLPRDVRCLPDRDGLSMDRGERDFTPMQPTNYTDYALRTLIALGVATPEDIRQQRPGLERLLQLSGR